MNIYSIKSCIAAVMIVIACGNASSTHAMGSKVAWKSKAKWDQEYQQANAQGSASSASASSATPAKPVTMWNGATVGAQYPANSKPTNVWKWMGYGTAAGVTAAGMWAAKKAITRK